MKKLSEVLNKENDGTYYGNGTGFVCAVGLRQFFELPRSAVRVQFARVPNQTPHSIYVKPLGGRTVVVGSVKGAIGTGKWLTIHSSNLLGMIPKRGGHFELYYW